ncbi:SpoIID/LytB domain-containing protein [Neobacillus sp. NPDC093127]|uniref:SpoIID/LytB domain-containing protein n=1 Tax=Neobacillus sp. NPDC093127 TaxID=3364296 RepID=UPI00381274D0
MRKILLTVAAFALLISLLPAGHGFALQPEPLIKVKLINFLGNKTEISLKPNGDYLTNDPNFILQSGSTYLLKQVNEKLSLYKDGSFLNSFETFSVLPQKANSQLSINNRLYLGSFDFSIENKQFVRPVNSILMEDYLKGVVPIEMYPSLNIEALKTQAVAARTYALGYLNRGVIDDTISYQVYGGYNWTLTTTKAVDETKGQAAQVNGRLIDAVYSASNGGITESNANAWGSPAVPYLSIKNDTYDPKVGWDFSFRKTQIDLTSKDLSKSAEWWSATNETDVTITTNIKLWLSNNGYTSKDIKIVSISDFSLHSPGSGGRVSKGSITIDFLEKDKVDAAGNIVPQRVVFSNVNASTLRAMIGNRVMLSYLVDKIDADGNSVTVKGFGDGHGVGMSQWGAKYMADAGKTYEEILKFYYTGITLVNMYDATSQSVSAPTSQSDSPATTVPPSQSVSPATVAKTGWVKENGKWFYLKSGGVRTTGWLKDANKWYYLNKNGEMLTGWLKDANKWYYLNQSGAMLTGWQKVSGKWYYLQPSGAMATGWLMDKGTWYYLTSSGAMATGWITVSGKRYYLTANGVMVTNRQWISGKWYQFHASGYLIK